MSTMTYLRTLAALSVLLATAAVAHDQAGTPLGYRSALDDYRRLETPADPANAWRALNDEAGMQAGHVEHGSDNTGDHDPHGARPANDVENAPAPKDAYMRHVVHPSQPAIPSVQDAHKHHHH